jgi:hypothetical protein
MRHFNVLAVVRKIIAHAAVANRKDVGTDE